MLAALAATGRRGREAPRPRPGRVRRRAGDDLAHRALSLEAHLDKLEREGRVFDAAGSRRATLQFDDREPGLVVGLPRRELLLGEPLDVAVAAAGRQRPAAQSRALSELLRSSSRAVRARAVARIVTALAGGARAVEARVTTPRARASCAAKRRRARVPLLATGPVGRRTSAGWPARRSRRGSTAERIVREARAKADAIVAARAEEGRAAAAEARRAGRAWTREAELVARWLALARQGIAPLDSDAERIVPIAVRTRRAPRGRDARARARPASRRSRPVCSPRLAAPAARPSRPTPSTPRRSAEHLATAGLDPASVEVRADETLARGALRLHTDVGIIDAQLAPRLERLAEALRDALR